MKKFNAQECIKALGLDEGGRVQQAIDSEILRVCDPYIPMDNGDLIRSGIANTVIGSGEVVWNTPYAHFVHEGIVYVDPVTGSPYARKDAQKVPTDRKLQYQGAPMRGDHWFDRAMQNGGIKAIEKAGGDVMKK